ncbi:MAG: thiamine-phosphate kinase [Woeseia sp.]
MDEFEIIRRFFVRSSDDESVLLGINDDGAVLSPAADREIVCVVDTIVDGVHYPAGFPAADIGFRAVEVNLSDIAAMGGRPRWMTLALTLSQSDEEWLGEFAKGLFESAAAHDVSLVGGDTTRGQQTVVSVQVIGDVTAATYITRAGATAGDHIFVTGTPGDAAGGLALLQDGNDDSADARYLIQRFSRPTARVAFGAAIAGFASAAIDLSDGLFGDAQKLLTASEAGARLDLDRLPLSAPLRRVFGDERALQFALGGGDDYELCFTAHSRHEAKIQAIGEKWGLPVTRIGQVESGSQLICHRNGQEVEFESGGYKHF